VHTVMAVDLCLASAAAPTAGALLSHLQGEGSEPIGLPILFLQALGVFPEATEMRALAATGPKACVASWIARNLVAGGVPADEAVPIVNGVEHRTFHVIRSIADRPAGIAMNHNPHPLKNMGAGIEALERVDRETGVPTTLFGARAPARPLRGHMRFVDSPRQSEVAQDILAAASVYLQPSTQEGFGLCALEAMACGCALVTTDNGGSEDYAVDGETAVVCETEPGAMAEAVVSLLHDDARRVRLATEGAERAKGFTWSAGAERLRALGAAYLADPDSLRRGAPAPLDPSVRWLDRG
jgi:glycosyltransferase involved in cell wall biosynthesis